MNWNNLTKEERARYMRLQMSRGNGSYARSPYLPDDCGECGACGQPTIGGSGWCPDCYREWRQLRDKLEGKNVMKLEV